MFNKVFAILGLSASDKLTNEIIKSENVNIKREEVEVKRFADGELLCRPNESVRGKEIFLIQSTSNPVNENLMELLITLDALKRGSAEKIYVIIPYFGYSRQDRKAFGRQPITCKLVADMIQKAGADRVLTVDMHSSQSMGFFDIPMDDLKANKLMAKYIIENIANKETILTDKISVVAPDQGGLPRARKLAKSLSAFGATTAVIDKRRPKPNEAVVEFILGDVKEKTCFLIDDMIDTAGTICNAARAIKDAGASSVYIIATHGVFSGPATERLSKVIKDGIVKKVIISDTISQPKDKMFEGLEIISLANLIAGMINALASSSSLSDVYNKINLDLNEKIDELIIKEKGLQ